MIRPRQLTRPPRSQHPPCRLPHRPRVSSSRSSTRSTTLPKSRSGLPAASASSLNAAIKYYHILLSFTIMVSGSCLDFVVVDRITARLARSSRVGGIAEQEPHDVSNEEKLKLQVRRCKNIGSLPFPSFCLNSACIRLAPPLASYISRFSQFSIIVVAFAGIVPAALTVPCSPHTGSESIAQQQPNLLFYTTGAILSTLNSFDICCCRWRVTGEIKLLFMSNHLHFVAFPVHAGWRQFSRELVALPG